MGSCQDVLMKVSYGMDTNKPPSTQNKMRYAIVQSGEYRATIALHILQIIRVLFVRDCCLHQAFGKSDILTIITTTHWSHTSPIKKKSSYTRYSPNAPYNSQFAYYITRPTRFQLIFNLHPKTISRYKVWICHARTSFMNFIVYF